MSKARRIFTHVAIILGIALLVLAVAVPVYLKPKLKVVPLNIESRTTTETKTSILMSASNIASGKASEANKDRSECADDVEDKTLSCFIDDNIRLYSTRYTKAVEPSDANQVTIQSSSIVARAGYDKSGTAMNSKLNDEHESTDISDLNKDDVISASVDKFTLDRKTGYPVEDPVSVLTLNSPQNGVQDTTAPFTREGLQIKFPFDTEQRSYPYWDSYVGGAVDINYDGQTTLKSSDGKNSLDVYKFSQELGPVNTYDSQKKLLELDGSLSDADKSTLGSLRLTLKGKVWGLDTDEDVTMDRYYVNSRTIEVEPTTGQIIGGHEKVWLFYAKDKADAQAMIAKKDKELANPTRTALYFEGDLDPATVDASIHDSGHNKKLLGILGSLPWAAGVPGILLVLIGLWLRVSGRNKA